VLFGDGPFSGVPSAPAPGHRHRLGVHAGAQKRARELAGHAAAFDHLASADEHMLDTTRLGVEPAGTARQIATCLRRVAADPLGIEHHQVGMPALGDPTPPAKAVETSGHFGEFPHGFLESEQRALAYKVPEDDRRIVGVAHDVEVGSGIGPAEHHSVVFPYLLSNLPARVGRPE